MRPTSLVALGLVSLVGCGGGEAAPDAKDDVVNCELETADVFVAGLEKVGMAGRFKFRLMSATPAPPARYDNAWTVQVTKVSDGSPVTGASIIVTPFMPEHGHGSPKDAVMTALPTAGEYKLTPVYLSMPAVWETTIDVTSPSGDDSAMYRFCIPDA